MGVFKSLRRRLAPPGSLDAYEYLLRLSGAKPGVGGVEPADAPHAARPALQLADPERQIAFLHPNFQDGPQKELLRRGFTNYRGILEAIATFARPDSSVLDVGANVGAITLWCARLPLDGLRVHAFEPSPVVAPWLRRNVALNGCANVVVREVGLGREPGSFDFHMEVESSTNTGLSSFQASARHKDAKVVKVEVATLDALARELGRVSVVKVDTQGTELAVLQGGERLLREQRPAIVLEHEDVHFPDPSAARAALRAFLGSLGYGAFVFSRKDPRLLLTLNWDAPLNADLLALPNDR